MSDSTVSSIRGDPSIVIVKPPEDIAAAIKDMVSQAVEIFNNMNLDVSYCDPSDCLGIKTRQRYVYYLFHRFEGPAFEHMKGLKYRIYGPMAIIHCFRNKKPLPKDGYPVFCPAMTGVLATCSNVGSDKRIRLSELIEFMGGFTSRNLTDTNTHLVAGEVGSKKYKAAADLKMKVVLPEWVEATWTALSEGQDDSTFRATTKEYVDKFVCPIFKGLTICSTGLDVDKRKEVKEIVQTNGGTYSGDMAQGVCTHLLTNTKESQKYKVAQSWQVLTVTPNWAQDSIKLGYCCDENKYKVRSKSTSTPTGLSGESALSSTTEPNCSAISVVTGIWNGAPNETVLSESTFSRTSVLGRRKLSSDAGIGPNKIIRGSCSRIQSPAAVSHRSDENDSTFANMPINENAATATFVAPDVPSSLTEALKPAPQESGPELPDQPSPDLRRISSGSAAMDISNVIQTPSDSNLDGPCRFRFDFGQMIDSLKTPDGTVGYRPSPTVSDRVTRGLRRFNERFQGDGNLPTGSCNTNVCRVENEPQDDGSSQRNENVVEKVTRKFKLQHRLSTSTATPMKTGPLRGLVIVVSNKLSAQQSELNKLASELGADYRWKFDSSCTHFIFEGRVNDMSREYRMAKEQKKHIVSPHWLFACSEDRIRLDEALYPHSYNPRKALEVRCRSFGSQSATTNVPVNSASKRSLHEPGERASLLRSSSHDNIEGHKKTDHGPEGDNACSKEGDPSNVQIAGGSEDCSMASGVDDGGQPESSNTSTPVPDADRVPIEDTCEGVECGAEEALDQPTSLSIRESFHHQLARLRKSQGWDNGKDSPISDIAGLRSDQVGLSHQISSSAPFNASAGEPSSSVRDRKSDSQPGCANGITKSLSPYPVTYNTDQSTLEPRDWGTSRGIIWDDLSERKQREGLGGPLRHQDEQTQSLALCMDEMVAEQTVGNEGQQDDMDNSATSNVNGNNRPDKVYKFMITNMGLADRDRYGQIIERLGGHLITSQSFDPDATHLIVDKPTRNEKLLASIASGKWVLTRGFLEASDAANKFVEEEPYEWGNQDPHSNDSSDYAANKLACSCSRWRKQLQKNSSTSYLATGAFFGWEVILCTSTNKEASFRRLLQAGGAQVYNSDSGANFEGLTHAIIDEAAVGSLVSKDRIRKLNHAGVTVLKLQYIPAYLTEEELDLNDYIIEM